MAQEQFDMELPVIKKKMKGRRYTPEIMKLNKLLHKMTVTKVIYKTNPNPNKRKTTTKKELNTVKTKAKTKIGLYTRIIKKRPCSLMENY